MKFFGRGLGPRNNRLDIGGDPAHDRDLGFSKRILYLLLRFPQTAKNKI